MAAGEIGRPSLRVLRLCSVFEAPEDVLRGRGVRFDPVGGMQNHTAQLTRALAALGVRQAVITHRPPGAPRRQSPAPHSSVRRFGLPVPWFRQLFAAPAALAAFGLAREVDLVHVHQGEDLAVLPIGLAAARLLRHADAHIVIVGDGPRRASLEQAIRAHSLEHRARILGFRSHGQVPQILSHCDLFCLPSRYEELSSALLEAMRAGLPIVATRVGGLPEALDGAGILVDPDDPAALAEAIDALLSDRDLARRLATAARERARGYEWSELAAGILDVYQAA